MSDYLMREFRAQLTTALELVQRRTMFEIMKIFEGSLHDHQMELSQKGEEIAHLKVKLQRAEVRLTDAECGADKGAEKKKTLIIEESEDVVIASGLTPDVPEIDFEVPDDWCAPVGYENMGKQEEGECPSVRLRPLSIALWHLPIIKEEAVSLDIDSHQQKKGNRSSMRESILNKKQKHTRGRCLPTPSTQSLPVSSDIKTYKTIKDFKKEYNTEVGARVLRGGARHSTRKGQDNKPKSKVKASDSKSTEQDTVGKESGKKYSCKFCTKVFDTEFGRSVHVRSHKRCRGCKKEFAFPSFLQGHKPYCGPLKIYLAKKAQSTEPPKPKPHAEEKVIAASKEQAIIKKKRTPSSSSHSEPSTQRERSTKKYSCPQCDRQCQSGFHLKQHMLIHTGEKPFPCNMCPKKFRIKQSLNNHFLRRHQDQVNASETNGELAWTEPLEGNEESQADSISPSSDTSRVMKHNNVPRKNKKGGRVASQLWQTMGTECSNGYACSLCHKVLKNRYLLVNHNRLHTGEKPIKCSHCSARFRYNSQLSMHRKKCGLLVLRCDKCDKEFSSERRYEKHMATRHRDWPLSCKGCGKGFILKGRLKTHMEDCRK